MTHGGTELAAHERWRVIDCAPCGFVHIVPLPTPEEIEEIYSFDYYDREKPEYLTKTQQELPYWELVYAERFRVLEDLIGGPGRVLDVGCSGGWFLDLGRRRGWDVMGIEPSEQAVAVAKSKGIPVHQTFLHRLDGGHLAGQFQVVSTSFVVEHLIDPAAFFRWAARMLTPGGILCVEVPNDFNRLQDVVCAGLDKPRYWVVPPHHINYFTFDTLESLFRATGYEVVLRTTTFPMELFLLLGFDYVGNDSVGRRCHERRMDLEQLLSAAGADDVKAQLYRVLASVGIGREAIVYGRRSEA